MDGRMTMTRHSVCRAVIVESGRQGVGQQHEHQLTDMTEPMHLFRITLKLISQRCKSHKNKVNTLWVKLKSPLAHGHFLSRFPTSVLRPPSEGEETGKAKIGVATPFA